MGRFILIASFTISVAAAQTGHYNFDEKKVPPYTLPDPLVLADGEHVRDARAWTDKRRPELLALFADQVYGKTPPQPAPLRTSEVFTDRKALDGKAIRKQVTLYFTPDNAGPQMHVLLYLPASPRGPVPVFLGLNFNGNQTVDSDPGILSNDVWVRDPADQSATGSKRMLHLPPDDRSRGANASNWQVEKLIARGYGLATVYYYDIEPDFSGGVQYGVRPTLLKDPESWSALGAWAWGLSRALDFLLTDKSVDPLRIALLGHSRLGKAALWAAAQDPRFSLVISNESGKGGASLLKRGFGETTDHLNSAFPEWFCANYKQYTGHPEKLPLDGNELLALIAPRPLYVASAADDLGSDPKGEFLAAVNAGRVYQLFGKKGLGVSQMPPVDTPIMHDIGYHVRTGKHDVTEFDWNQYLAFADMHWGEAKPPTK
ncbi:MAG: acetylxylan esterase [Acidobacteriota bacterium]